MRNSAGDCETGTRILPPSAVELSMMPTEDGEVVFPGKTETDEGARSGVGSPWRGGFEAGPCG